MRVEAKVKAGAAGAAAGGAVSTFALWVLGCLVWGAPWDASSAAAAVVAVPAPVQALVVLVVPGVVAFVAGYRARHTRRADLGDRVGAHRA